MSTGPLHEQGCLFCLGAGRRFTSVEHVFPEGMGNKTMILPRGVVCDDCNSGPLSLVDAALLDFLPIQFLRLIKGIPTKKGRAATVASAESAKIEQLLPGHLSVTYLDDSAIETRESGFKLNLRSPGPMTEIMWSRIARAIYKIALESVYIDFCAKGGFDSRFDDLRRVVLGELPSSGCLSHSKKHGEPGPSVTVRYWPWILDGQEILFIELDVWGLRFRVEALHRAPAPTADIPPEATFNVLSWTADQVVELPSRRARRRSKRSAGLSEPETG